MDGSSVLRGIASDTQQFLRRLGTPEIRRPQLLHTIPTFHLPEPRSVSSILKKKGLKASAAERLSRIYIHNGMRLKATYESLAAAAIHSCFEANSLSNVGAEVAAIYSTYTSCYSRDLQRWADFNVAMSTRRISSIRSVHQDDYLPSSPTNPAEKRATFKQDAASCLEGTFMRNAYPSRAEKLSLAVETGLDYKQINVWFQNRRSRLKQEGTELQKLIFVDKDMSVSPVLSVASGLESESPCTKFRVIRSEAPSRYAKDPFHHTRAVHAFPAPYPPVCDYDPFPRDGLLRTPWPRAQATRQYQRVTALPDIDSLICEMEQLDLYDHSGSERASSPRTFASEAKLGHHSSPCWPIITRPLSAPLPSLIRATVTVRSLSHSSNTSSRHDATTYSHSGMLPLSSACYPLPRHSRRPLRHTLALRRENTHPYLSARSDLSRKSSRLSPASSLSSICSDISSSSSSSLDSPLATPPLLLVGLPDTAKSSISASVPDLDRLFDVSSFEP